MSISSILNFLKTFQNSPKFANLAIHAWLSAFLVTAALAHGFNWILVLIVACALESVKEFLFDHYIEIPNQTIQEGWGDLQGYLIGNVLALALWFIPHWLGL